MVLRSRGGALVDVAAVGVVCVAAARVIVGVRAPFVSQSLSCGVVLCPVRSECGVWSAAACSWIAMLVRSMSSRVRASACVVDDGVRLRVRG